MHGGHAGFQRMDPSIATVQVHDEIVVGFPRFTHTASSLGRECRSGYLGPRPANSPTLVISGGIVVDAILVQQPFDVLVVKLFTLIGLQLDGAALCRFVFQQMAQPIAHGRAAFTL